MSQEGTHHQIPGCMVSGGSFLGCAVRAGQRGSLLSSPETAPDALWADLPVCIKGRDPGGIVQVVGQDGGVVIKPKKVIGTTDPLLLTLRELWEPGWKEP